MANIPSSARKYCKQTSDTEIDCEKGPKSHKLMVSYEKRLNKADLAESLKDKRKTYDSDLDSSGRRLTPGDCSTGSGHYMHFEYDGGASGDVLCSIPNEHGHTEMFWTDDRLLVTTSAGYYTETQDYNFDPKELAGQWKSLRLVHQ